MRDNSMSNAKVQIPNEEPCLTPTGILAFDRSVPRPAKAG